MRMFIFDLDGTLVDSLGNYLQAYREILKKYGFNLADDEIVKKCFGRTEEAICKDLGIPEKAEEFRDTYFEFVKKILPSLQVFPDAIETLEYLKNKQLNIGIITFARDWYIKELSRLFDLDKYTQVAISFNDVKNPKPNPEAIIKACGALGIKESEALIVGDSKSDILMGKNAGSKTALYTPEENRKFYNFEELIEKVRPDFVIKHLSEIRNLVD